MWEPGFGAGILQSPADGEGVQYCTVSQSSPHVTYPQLNCTVHYSTVSQYS